MLSSSSSTSSLSSWSANKNGVKIGDKRKGRRRKSIFYTFLFNKIPFFISFFSRGLLWVAASAPVLCGDYTLKCVPCLGFSCVLVLLCCVRCCTSDQNTLRNRIIIKAACLSLAHIAFPSISRLLSCVACL